MQGQQDVSGFIKSFTGTHHFVLDYLVEEVLQQQSAQVQTFLLHTSILDRICGPLCDALLLTPIASGQATLAYLERANLFLVPLDNERRWYRYHHLFAALLRQRLHQSVGTSAEVLTPDLATLHIRASQWHEDNGLPLEAFQHAAAANDVARAERLIDGRGLSRHSRGVVTAMVNWLAALPTAVLNARPSLWWRHGSLLLIIGQTAGVAEKLQAAENALADTVVDDKVRNLIGQIAGARAVLALTKYQPTTMLAESRRALEYLFPDNLSSRASANWTLGHAHHLQGDRAAAALAFTEAITLSQTAGDRFTTILALGGLGQVQEAQTQLHLAAETYRSVLDLAGDQPLQIISGAHLGLARIFYEWNDLDAAEQHGQQSLHLARQYDKVVDRFIVSEVVLARLKLARGKVAAAATLLAQTSQSAHQQRFAHRLPEVAAAPVLTLLRQGQLPAAAQLAQVHDLPLSQARVYLALGDTAAALAALEPVRQQAEAKGWADERLAVLTLQAVAYHAHGAIDTALQILDEALMFAEREDFVRLFVDEGLPMAHLLSAAATQGMQPDYTGRLLAILHAEMQQRPGSSPLPSTHPAQALLEPLSERELEVLRLIAEGYSNREIGTRLFLALDTIKGHNRHIFGKLQVQSRTEAIARARELGVL
jgi:LuxR family maltose regulon positive regulatory protein